MSAPPAPKSIQVRQRSRRACRPCQQRRRKCDGAEPCATCVGYGYECHYVRHDASRIVKRRQEPRYPTFNGKIATESSPSPLPTATKEQNGYGSLPATSHDVLDPTKSRFIGGHSAYAFPMSLGKELNAVHPPRLHSFASNAGTRKPPKLNSDLNVDVHLTLDEVRRLSEKYFTVAQAIFGFIDRPLFERRCNDHWSGTLQSIAFQAVVAGVCAIGSLFSGPDSSPREEDLIQFAKTVLECSGMNGCISQYHVGAWILRAIYLRCTMCPHASWIAISTTIHVAEATGLHREHSTVVLTAAVAPLSVQDVEYRRRTFWVAWALNNIFSCEYGRTPTYIKDINCLPPVPVPGDYTTDFIDLVQLFYATTVNAPDPRHEEDQLIAALASLTTLPSEPALLTLLRVDKTFSIYRRLRLLSRGAAATHVAQILPLGQAGLAAARALAADDTVWWNILGTPFHFLCILLAADSLDSLALVPDALAALDAIANRLQTHMAVEALATARLLVQAAQRNKMRQLDLLGGYLGVAATTIDDAPVPSVSEAVADGVDAARADVVESAPGTDEVQSDFALAQWFSDGDINWDDLLMNGIGQPSSFGVPAGCIIGEGY